MRRNRIRILLFLVGLQAAFSPVQAENQVTLQLKWKHQFQFAGYYAAAEKGFYREAGLNVRFIEGKPGLDPAEVVLSGGAEYGVGTPEILLQRAKGAPLVVLGVIFQHSPYVFLTLKESGISDVGGLAGKKIEMEPQAAELYAYLNREKVPRESLTILPHSFTGHSLIDGKSDAMSAYSTDELFSLHQAGIPYSVFSPRSGGVDFYGDCFFTTEQEIKNHPERVRAFYEATLKGWQYAMDHPDEIADLILARYPSEKSREALQFEAAAMKELMHPEIVPVGYMYAGRWEHIRDTYMELGMLKSPVSLEGFLYQPNPKSEAKRLYWLCGGLLLGAAVAWGIILPLWRLNKNLRLAKERADQANQAKARFVAMVSHELRTPMNGVLGFASLLRHTTLAQEQKEYVEMIEKSAQSLLGLINDLLDFSKIEAGRVKVEEVDFSLSQLLDDVMHFFQPSLLGKNIVLHLQPEKSVPEWVRGDPTRIRQILLNLVGNALKFTPSGKVSLEVAARPRAGDKPPGHEIDFVIRDTGPGMTPEQLGRIFQPFEQADSSISRQYGGTGLGLPICKGLTESMGGSLEIESIAGKGTFVRCSIPLKTGQPSSASSTKAPAASPLPASSLSVLVAEDDRINAQFMVVALKKEGIVPELAENGTKALAAWEARRHDVIFMDYQMPGVDGVAVIREIRKREARESSSPRCIVIGLTAAAGDDVRRQFMEAGADGYLTKPVSRKEIAQTLVSLEKQLRHPAL